MIISITELHCKSYWKLPAFILRSMKVAGQAKKTPGNISTYIRASGLKAYTLTTWQDMEAMKAFRNHGAHKEAMKTISQTASAFRSKSWEADTVPVFKEAMVELEKVEMRYT